ncbi:MAG: hypothetical protein ACTSPE_10385 [Candidatus Thorarchaeota archaeon]
MDYSPKVKSPVVRLFEKLAKWLALSENAAPALAALFLEKYSTGRRLSSEEISQRTGYSRASTGMIVSQLLVSGIITGERDPSQVGRGRKRILYGIDGDVSRLFRTGMIRMLEQLKSIRREILELLQVHENKETVGQLLNDLRENVDESIECLASLPMLAEQD